MSEYRGRVDKKFDELSARILLFNNKGAQLLELEGLITGAYNASIKKTMADINSKSEDRRGFYDIDQAYLCLAASKGHLSICKLLIENGADPERRDREMSRRPLHWAALWGFDEIVTYLLDKGAAINATDMNAATALHLAARNNNLSICRILVQRGAATSAKCGGRTALMTAIAQGQAEVAEFFLQECGFSPEENDKSGDTLLHHAACRSECLQIIDRLVEGGIQVDVLNKAGQTPLYLAATKSEDGNMEALLRYGANLDVRCGDQELTPMHAAVQAQSGKSLSFLVDRGAHIDAKNADMRTPLHLAVLESDNRPCVNYLLNKGADIEACDKNGLPPYNLALQEYAEILQQARKENERYQSLAGKFKNAMGADDYDN